MESFAIPNKTIKAFGANGIVFPHNLNLFLTKYHLALTLSDISTSKEELFFYISSNQRLYKDFIEKRFHEIEREYQNNKQKNKLDKLLAELNSYLKRHGKIEINNTFSPGKEIEKYHTKIREMRKELFDCINCSLNICNFNMNAIASKAVALSTSSRLIVGLGSTSVLETSIRLHHIYGVPYIPSSAIKGLLRAYKMWELSDWDIKLSQAFEIAIKIIYEKCNEPKKEFAEKLMQLEEKDLKPEDRILFENRKKIIEKQEALFPILSIFGTQSHKGALIILDAYPERFDGFDIDIMNPHYPDYYQGNEPPSDWQNPTPIKFLTIPGGTRFNFYFINPYDGLETDLKEALTAFGIGAKAALGYGIFTI